VAIRPLYQLLLICCAVLGAYYPAIFAEVSLLDDVSMINWLINVQEVNLKELFFPHHAGGGYYRPLIGATFLFDRFAWFAQPEMMHLENILLHLLNALLVFAVARLLFSDFPRSSLFPLVAALLFGLHPLATESVCWISGRTDLLAGVFVLASFWFVVKFLREGRWLFLLPAVIFVGIGALAKETALAFIPAALLIIWGRREEMRLGTEGLHLEGQDGVILTCCIAVTTAVAVTFVNFWAVAILALISFALFSSGLFRGEENSHRGVRFAAILGSSGLFCVALSWCIRRSAFTSDLSKISQTITLMKNDLGHTLQVFLGAEAFYFKKFILALPLDAAIREIDPLYSLAGVVLLVFCLFLLARPTLFSGLLLGGFCMTIPALPLAFGTIAWTAYAERYVYLALPFWLLALGSLLPSAAKGKRAVLIWGTTLVILSMAGATFQRTLVWSNNIEMFADMVDKSPEFKTAHGLYMQALMQKKLYREAEEQYRIAQGLYSLVYEEQYDLFMASILQEQGRVQEVEPLYRMALEKSRGQKPAVLTALIAFYGGKASEARPAERDRYERLVLDYTRKLYELDKDPHTLYQLATLQLRIGERDAGIKGLQEVLLKLPANDSVRTNAEKLLRREVKP
jgi:protein O-mannosyl-transferase